MDYHKNARTVVWSREQMARQVVEHGLTLAAAAAVANVSAKTAAKWVRRYRALGVAGLTDRSCRPHRLYTPTSLEQAELVEQMRRQRWTGLRISQQTGPSRATVSRILRRRRLSRMRDLEPRQPVQRYEHERPGDLLHLDIKKLGRIARPGHRVTGNLADRTRRVGRESVHVAIDDTPASPSRPSSRMRRLVQRSLSLARHWRITHASTSISRPCSRTTDRPIVRGPSRPPAARSASSTASPDPIRHAPTERPSALSEQRCRNGLTPRSIKTQNSDANICHAGCMNTTGTGRTQAWHKNHPSAEQGLIGTTC